MHKVVVLGTGPAGLTAAIYLARANMNPVVITGPEPGGQLTTTTDVENFPGFPDGVMGPELMNQMEKQAKRFGAEFISGWVNRVDLSNRPFKLYLNDQVVETEGLILSTGASAKLLQIAGEKENIGQGVSTCATCDGFFFRNKKLIVVGGGDSAMEEATFLTKFASEVTIVHRRNELRASKIMQDRARSNDKIRWSLNRTPIEVISAEQDGIKGLLVKNNETGKEEMLGADGLFVAIGHKPNTEFLDGQVQTDLMGYIQVQPGTTRTNIPGVFACGDVQDHIYRQAITAAGTGCMAALDCERYLEGSRTQDWSVSLPL